MAESTKKIPRSEKTAGETSALKQATVMLKSSNREFALVQNRDDLDAFVQANEAIMNGIAVLGSEMMSFGDTRLRAYTESSKSLVDCKDAEQVFRIQREFAESATQQYLDQTNKLLAIMAKMTEDLWTPLQEHTRQTLRGLTKETRSSKHT